MSTAVASRPSQAITLRTDHLAKKSKKEIARSFCAFLDFGGTATARGTFYNTKEEQEEAARARHRELFGIDRGIYGMSLVLPVTDYTRQMGVGFLLKNPRNGPAVLDPEQESKLLVWLIQELPPQRMLKLFGELRANRVNNARTRKLILRTILSARKMVFWAVKYRNKMRAALEHAWGKRLTGIINSILRSDTRNAKEDRILKQNILRYADNPIDRRDVVFETVGFILGFDEHVQHPTLVAFREAKTDLDKGRRLPYEVLEGIRSRYHTDRTSAEVLKLTKGTLSTGQKMAVQRKAKKADVKIEFDPKKQDSVRLYIYAYEMKAYMKPEIREALDAKAKEAASRLPLTLDHVGIVIDCSRSMDGSKTQRKRPIAAALATRDMLQAASNKATVITCGGVGDPTALMYPSGSSSMAEGLVRVLKEKPDCVYIITDGYENSPAGRVSEVVRILRSIGNETPIQQISPVAAAETGGLRALSPLIPAMPLSKPEAVGLAMIKGIMETDLDRGITGLARASLPQIGLEV